MPWLPRRVPDEVRAQARRRLASLGRPLAHLEVELPEPETPHEEVQRRGRGGVAARLPTTVRDGRVELSRPAAFGVALLAAAALVLAGSYAWRGRAVEAILPTEPTASVVEPSASGGPPAAGPSAAATSGGPAVVGVVVVDVAGKVRRPGVVRLPLGSRVVDAIEAAGGVRGAVDLTPLNLARVLGDGEQVLVGVDGPALQTTGPGGAPGNPADAVVDLNTATLEQLDVLPGVGPVLAQRIIDWRTAHGRFSSIDELREVSGIGDARFADLSPRVRV